MTGVQTCALPIFYKTWQGKVCDIVSQSQKGEIIVYIIKAVQQEHFLPPVRAEPVLVRKQPIAQRKQYKNKKERISQTGKGGPSVDTGGFLFVQNGLSRLFPVWVSGQFMAFFTSAISILKTLVVAIGAGLAVWGVINLLEGYGNDNPGAKSQGIKQLMAGGGVVLIGTQLIPLLGNLFS